MRCGLLILLALVGDLALPSCSPAEERPTGELELRGWPLIVGVSQEISVMETRDFHKGGAPDPWRPSVVAASCENDACVVTADSYSFHVTPLVTGRIRLRVVVNAEFADREKTFDLDVAPGRLLVYYDPTDSPGVLGGVAAHTKVAWRVGVEPATLPPLPTFEWVATPDTGVIRVRSGDAVVTPAGIAGWAHDVEIGDPGEVVFDVELGSLRRSITVRVIDPATVATSLEVHVEPNPHKATGPEMYVDVGTPSPVERGAPVDQLALAYPDESVNVVLFGRDGEGRLFGCDAERIATSEPSSVDVSANGFDPDMVLTPTAIGATAVRFRVGARETTLRVVAR